VYNAATQHTTDLCLAEIILHLKPSLMSNVEESINKALNVPVTNNSKQVESHKQAAKHYLEAARHHEAAARYHEAGDGAKAAQSAIKAFGHQSLAADHQREQLKHSALTA
jgi:hypothetical protein